MKKNLKFSNNYFQKQLEKFIPGGAHTYSRGQDQFSLNTPKIASKGSGPYLFSINGEKYLDYSMGLRSVTLGYNNKIINNGAIAQIKKGNNLSLPSEIELEAAKELINLIPGAEMVKFAKHGSSVTTAAVKLARSYTNKEIVCFPKEQPFFSFDDWFIGSTKVRRGVLKKISKYSKVFRYNDLTSLIKIFNKYRNNIAAVILEPATFLTPCLSKCKNLDYKKKCNLCKFNKNNFLNQVQKLCKKNNSLLILDEMITGFRWDLKGAQHFFGVKPDLSTFGKAMANGFSIAALVGKRKIMQLGSINKKQERTFLLSTTHGAEMSSLGAFVKTVKFYKKKKVTEHLWRYGSKLKKEINNIAKNLKIDKYFFIEGPSICLNYRTLDRNFKDSLILRTIFQQEMIKRKILMPFISPSFAHKSKEFNITIQSCKHALKVYKKALFGKTSNYLEGNAIKPVFRKFN